METDGKNEGKMRKNNGNGAFSPGLALRAPYYGRIRVDTPSSHSSALSSAILKPTYCFWYITLESRTALTHKTSRLFGSALGECKRKRQPIKWKCHNVSWIITDVQRGTSGRSRDVPIFVQFNKKFVQLMTHKERARARARAREKVTDRQRFVRNWWMLEKTCSLTISIYEIYPKPMKVDLMLICK